jgi:HlyD family secretion protein
MTRIHAKRRRPFFGMGAAFLVLVALAGCGSTNPNKVQGYVEGEYVYVAAAAGAALQTLYVQRGNQVNAGDSLFVLDDAPERAARDEAERKLAQGRANWEDLKKARRPTEIESLEAQMKQAKAALALSEQAFAREDTLFRSNASSPQDLDKARSARDQDRQRVAQLEADLATGKLPSRVDQIAAAEANVRALQASLSKANWDLAQKRQNAPQSGLVFDTLFREGEWVGAGKPVVALLPPENIKVRAFVPQTRIGAIQPGQEVRVFVDGVAAPFVGRVSFISPQAEYTPPVIYSQESRAKLVFMVEAIFDPAIAAQLHPGQPVDVEFGD